LLILKKSKASGRLAGAKSLISIKIILHYLINGTMVLNGLLKILPYKESRNNKPMINKNSGLYLNSIPFFTVCL